MGGFVQWTWWPFDSRDFRHSCPDLALHQAGRWAVLMGIGAAVAGAAWLGGWPAGVDLGAILGGLGAVGVGWPAVPRARCWETTGCTCRRERSH